MFKINGLHSWYLYIVTMGGHFSALIIEGRSLREKCGWWKIPYRKTRGATFSFYQVI